MILRECRFFSFRNLLDQQVRFHPRANFIIGQNGQGKTNLVEGISLLSQGRSFRTSHHRELIRWGGEAGSVFGYVDHRLGSDELGVVIERERRTVYVNQQEIRPLTTYLGRLPCVTFSPDDIAVVKGAPLLRRGLIDRHLVDINPAILEHLLVYQRALKNKNALLKSGDGTAESLEPWNKIMAQHARAIIQARRAFLERLEGRARTHHHSFAPQDEVISLRWKETLEGGDGSIECDALEHVLSQALPRELRIRSALVGPHRDDVLMSLGSHDARIYASQGQARSLILALKLATIDLIEEARSESPLIVLDDVNSELDRDRAQGLFERIFAVARQTFVTGTDLPDDVHCEGSNHQAFEVIQGAITPM